MRVEIWKREGRRDYHNQGTVFVFLLSVLRESWQSKTKAMTCFESKIIPQQRGRNSPCVCFPSCPTEGAWLQNTFTWNPLRQTASERKRRWRRRKGKREWGWRCQWRRDSIAETSGHRLRDQRFRKKIRGEHKNGDRKTEVRDERKLFADRFLKTHNRWKTDIGRRQRMTPSETVSIIRCPL